MQINFYNKQKVCIVLNVRALESIFNKIALLEGYKINNLSFIFVSDQYIKIINKRYLFHDFPTDVITFSFNTAFNISGDIFISIATVMYNANKYKSIFKNELFNVMIHGLLHLMNYNDLNNNQIIVMKNKEKIYFKMFNKS